MDRLLFSFITKILTDRKYWANCYVVEGEGYYYAIMSCYVNNTCYICDEVIYV